MTKLNAVKRLMAGRETGTGAGMLLYCPDSENFLILLRSDDNTWCGLGGGVEEGETEEEATRREAWEEGGLDLDVPVELIRITTIHHPDGFKFTNFLGLIKEEFLPVINDEHRSFQWCRWSDFPKEMHPKMMEAFMSSQGQAVLKRYTTALDSTGGFSFY